MKKFISWTVIFVLLIISAYTINYPIRNDSDQIEYSLKTFKHNKSTKEAEIEVKETLDIDNKKIVLYTENDIIKNAQFVKGLNGNYKIEWISVGSLEIRDALIKTDNGKYYIMMGMNKDNRLKYAEFELEKRDYKICIPDKEYFIRAFKVADDLEIHKNLNYKFYDKNNKDVTEKITDRK